MLVDAAVLTAVGMTTVFGFLGLLVCLMHLAARVIERFPGEPEEVATSAPLPVDVSGDDAQIAVVLAVVAAQRGEG